MTVFVRDLEAGQPVEIIRRKFVGDIAWMPDGSRVMVGGYDEGIRGTWSVPRLGGEAQRLHSAADGGVYVTVAPDASAIAVSNLNQTDSK